MAVRLGSAAGHHRGRPHRPSSSNNHSTAPVSPIFPQSSCHALATPIFGSAVVAALRRHSLRPRPPRAGSSPPGQNLLTTLPSTELGLSHHALAGAVLSYYRRRCEQRRRLALLVVSSPPDHPPPLPSSLTAEPSPITASSTLLHSPVTSSRCRRPVVDLPEAAPGRRLQILEVYPSPALTESPLG